LVSSRFTSPFCQPSAWANAVHTAYPFAAGEGRCDGGDVYACLYPDAESDVSADRDADQDPHACTHVHVHAVADAQADPDAHANSIAQP